MKKIVKEIVCSFLFILMVIGFIPFCLVIRAHAAERLDPEGVGQHEYTEILQEATDEDLEQLERVIYNEAGKCDDWRVRLAVAETVLNRVLADEWPNTIAGVCKQSGQFANWRIKGATGYELEAVSDTIENIVHDGRTVLPSTNYTFFAIGKQTLATNHILIGDRSRKWQYMWFGESKS